MQPVDSTANRDSKNPLAMARFLQPTLSGSEKRAATLLLREPAQIPRISLTEYASMAKCGQATIVRLCKRMGLSGFAELKSELLKLLVGSEHVDAPVPRVEAAEGMVDLLGQVFQINIQTLQDTLALAGGEEYEQALEALVAAKQISFFAIGDAMIPCESAMLKFRRIGRVCHADQDADMQMVNACNLRPGDVALAVSHTGSTRQVVEAVRVAKQHGATAICITKLDKSPLTKLCDIRLFTATSDITLGKEIIARRVAEQAILEALYLGVNSRSQPSARERINETSLAMRANKLPARGRIDKAK